ncbi:MAG: GDP-mannose 4,6-dehydratase [Oscillospiraceae bacterium]|nr:GDP-mannose 4,6-dehydratase [Oscillospiraceae bacterium]
MKSLVIGAAGFVGHYLCDYLSKCGHDVYATKLKNEMLELDVNVYDLDILNQQEISSLLNEIKPDMIFHLAAQSSVRLSWEAPQLTADVNIKGTINLLEALRQSDCRSKVLLIGSGEEYGYIEPGEVPVKETTPLRSGNIYAVTKVCQEMLGSVYARAYSMDIVAVRAFNHVGPGQLPQFVVSDFCRQTALIENGMQEPVINVGNLSARRDFTDVRDVVRAYVLLMESGVSGEVYNVGSGHARSIESMLCMILSQSSVDIKVQVDKSKMRPSDIPVIEADISKIYAHTSWRPQIDIEQTIKDTLCYWRSKFSR